MLSTVDAALDEERKEVVDVVRLHADTTVGNKSRIRSPRNLVIDTLS